MWSTLGEKMGSWRRLGIRTPYAPTVAKIMARLLKGMGVVATDKVFIHENARNALVDGNVGCTAGKAAKVINKAVGGVLFLDEARPPPCPHCTPHTHMHV